MSLDESYMPLDELHVILDRLRAEGWLEDGPLQDGEASPRITKKFMDPFMKFLDEGIEKEPLKALTKEGQDGLICTAVLRVFLQAFPDIDVQDLECRASVMIEIARQVTNFVQIETNGDNIRWRAITKRE